MSEITCAAIDCEHNDDQNCCKFSHIILNDHYVHTVYEGVQHFWTCKMYEPSTRARLFAEFLRGLKENGIEVVE